MSCAALCCVVFLFCSLKRVVLSSCETTFLFKSVFFFFAERLTAFFFAVAVAFRTSCH